MGTLHIILNIVLILASFNTARNKAVSKEAKLQKITLILGIVIAVLTIAMMFVK